MRPRLLDLFCGAGGASAGYVRAGFDVVGVDLAPQPRYPYPFHQADAMEFAARHGREYDAIHASPPCQGYSSLRSFQRSRAGGYPLLVGPVMDLLGGLGVPYVVENVPGSNLPTHVILCGSMFGLGADCGGTWHQLRRHREFACSWYFLINLSCRHVGRPVGVYGNGGSNRKVKDRPDINGFSGNARERRDAMGIDWMGRYELSQAIPPAYTEWLGRSLLRSLGNPCTPLLQCPGMAPGCPRIDQDRPR